MISSDVMQIGQIGVVVRDLWESVQTYHRLFGWEPWYIYEYKAPWFHSPELRGEPVEFSMISAEVEAGPIWLELLQPLDGPSIYKEWLDEHGEGLHHIVVGWDIEPPPDHEAEPTPPRSAVSLEDAATKVRRKFEAMGVNVLMGGRLGETMQFYYVDTQPMLKIIIESGGGDPADLKPVRTYP
jgi:methylmalonyl-CoA/ethylmalonyl-CoA epimerase